jgi:hypothetical protein
MGENVGPEYISPAREIAVPCHGGNIRERKEERTKGEREAFLFYFIFLKKKITVARCR